MDHRRGHDGAPPALHFIFAGGTLTPAQIAAIALPPDELAAWAFYPAPLAAALLPPKGAARLPHLLAAWHSGSSLYLEEGLPPHPDGGAASAAS